MTRPLRHSGVRFSRGPAIALLSILALVPVARGQERPFVIEVIDEQTGRGVPLVELETTSSVRYVTDSAGLVALDDPALMGRRVFFTVSSFGYEFPADGFGIRGRALEPRPGGAATLKLKRLNVAERLYRATGEGIYRDTMLAGRKPPIDHPLLNAQVTGQDSVQSLVYRDKIHFFWGDTGKLSYPLGNFSMTGATADLPGRGGLDPSVGINLKYFQDEEGFTRKMAPLPEPGAVWLDGFMVVPDPAGKPRMLAHFSRMKDLSTRVERGLMAFDDDKGIFQRLAPVPLDAPLAPGGHPLEVTVGKTKYLYFPVPYPAVRVRAEWASVTDLVSYEGFTCLKQGARYDKSDPPLDRDDHGRPRFSWKKETPPLEPRQLAELIKSGRIKRDECPFRLAAAEDGKPILLHGSSVAWNRYRERYVMIGLEQFGSSMLGEIWYAEAAAPEGPWDKAVKVATHHREVGGGWAARSENMDLYNPRHHPFLDQEGGRIIYFEGTYTNSFSGNPTKTPRYEYNNLMYRLDLSDPRLKPAHAAVGPEPR